MKLKRLLVWMLVFAMCFMLASCKNDAGDKDPTTGNSGVSQNGSATPLLYRVTDKSGNVIWLFGSIHIGRQDYYPLPDYVQNAFNNADSHAVELDVLAFEKDVSLQMKAISHLVYKDGSTIKDHIPQSLYQQAVDILKAYNYYVSALDLYCPAFWGSLIESLMWEELGGNTNLGIDRHLTNAAYEAEKEVLEIESAEFQYKMLAGFDDEVQAMLLTSAVQSYENKNEASASVEMMMDLWASGDESAFIAYLNTSDDTMTDKEKQIYEKYNQAMLVDRNLAMANYAENALLSGKEVFICVGAAHIVGSGAVAELLAQRGYTVECITN